MAVGALDWFIVVAAFVATLAIGLAVAARNRKATADDYFVGARAMSWPLVGASMFASNIGTEHFVGQAGSAAAGGLAVGLYEWLSVYNILMLAYAFSPLYLRLELTTVSQYVEDRFDGRCRTALTLISLLAYVTTKISATLITGVFLVQVLYGDEVNIYLVSCVIVLVTACYTVAGGLKAVMVTDAVQMVIFVVGGLMGLWVALSRVSVSEMRKLLPPDFFHVVRPSGEYAWSAMFFGQPITSCWYWCIDQFISQRVLAARSLADGQSGCIMAGFLKFLPPFMLCFPGMVARALFERCRAAEAGSGAHAPGGIADPWCSTGLDQPRQANMAYPLLVVYEFPAGLKGLIIAAMFMAMLSSLSSVYNSAATLITIDLYQAHWRPEATDQELVRCGRAAGVLMTLLTFCWFPVLSGQNGLIFLFTQNVMSHLFPTLVVVFVLGITTTTVNTQGALAGVGVGFVLGLLQLVLVLALEGERCSKGFFSWACMHFNHFAIFLALAVAAVTLLVSRRFPPPQPGQLVGRTIWSTTSNYGDLDDVGTAVPSGKAGSAATASAAAADRDRSPAPAVLGHAREDVGAQVGEASSPSAPETPPMGSMVGQFADASPSSVQLNVHADTENSVAEGWSRHDIVNRVLAVALGTLMAINVIVWA